MVQLKWYNSKFNTIKKLKKKKKKNSQNDITHEDNTRYNQGILYVDIFSNQLKKN